MICLAIDLSHCTTPAPSPQEIGEAMHATAKRLGVRVLLDAPAQYPDHGITYMMALAESHLVVSTWPEHHVVQIDLVSCRADTAPETAIEPLLALFGPEHTIIRRIPRWDPSPLPVAA
ncbi:S-adenosylmethionine decarboxylase [Nocardiopsis exhalans]|uniref:S-adenosylmethionine decarboxylase n=1 Tax=Nocardiopsis exhalans TaxID=163604 RepID=A0ABY5DCN5_9ACTN|nr:S-adenosylmethionine decarboxylase [Nocardiopsis exhalans]USY21720.1 S-adenosylmethionine decarboxylase [Nocardiopsis exhalans]